MNVAAWCPCCCFFLAPMLEKSSRHFGSLEGDILHSQFPEKSSGPWNATFYIPPYWKMLVPGRVSQGLDFYGMEKCKMSHSRDRKTFPAFGNAKGLLPGTRRVIRHGRMWKRSMGGQKNLLVATTGLLYQSMVMEFSDGKLKQKAFFHSVGCFMEFTVTESRDNPFLYNI